MVGRICFPSSHSCGGVLSLAEKLGEGLQLFSVMMWNQYKAFVRFFSICVWCLDVLSTCPLCWEQVTETGYVGQRSKAIEFQGCPWQETGMSEGLWPLFPCLFSWSQEPCQEATQHSACWHPFLDLPLPPRSSSFSLSQTLTYESTMNLLPKNSPSVGLEFHASKSWDKNPLVTDPVDLVCNGEYLMPEFFS